MTGCGRASRWALRDGELENWKALVETQDRPKLDEVLPEALVLGGVARSDLVCFLSNDGVMRSWRLSPVDVSIPVAKAYRGMAAMR
jgi:hypothetical protein